MCQFWIRSNNHKWIYLSMDRRLMFLPMWNGFRSQWSFVIRDQISPCFIKSWSTYPDMPTNYRHTDKSGWHVLSSDMQRHFSRERWDRRMAHYQVHYLSWFAVDKYQGRRSNGSAMRGGEMDKSMDRQTLPNTLSPSLRGPDEDANRL